MDMIHDPVTERSWASPIDLLHEIIKNHHAYLRKKLPQLDLLANRIARDRFLPAELVDRFQREFTVLTDLLEDHLSQQEGWLYPRIRQLCESVAVSGCAGHPENDWQSALQHAVNENQEALEWMSRVQESMRDPRWQDRDALVAELLQGIRDLADDLVTHVHRETEVLFPRIQQLLHARGLQAMAM
jgi:regulator of cell morphogenesis and NO signaling